MINITRTLWTPFVFPGSGPGDLTVNYTQQNGVWAQAGGLVRLGCTVQFTPTYTSAPGAFCIGGLPTFPPATDVNIWSGDLRVISSITWPGGATQLTPTLIGGLNAIGLNGSGSAVGGGSLTFAAFPSGTLAVVSCSIVFVDSN